MSGASEGPRGPELHRAADPARDQSYFLFSTTREQLDYLRFPLGGLASKAETRALAARYGLAVAEKPDSQDICFVPNGTYAAVIEKLRPGAAEPGEIVHLDGRVLGRHEGVIRYTVGQRRGLGIGGRRAALRGAARRGGAAGGRRPARGAGEPDGDGGGGELAGRRRLRGRRPRAAGRSAVRVRSTRPPKPARIHPLGPARARVELLAPEEGVAPGQACVFYAAEGTRVLGGGWIRRELTMIAFRAAKRPVSPPRE